jgi:hypothetical protein
MPEFHVKFFNNVLFKHAATKFSIFVYDRWGEPDWLEGEFSNWDWMIVYD